MTAMTDTDKLAEPSPQAGGELADQLADLVTSWFHGKDACDERLAAFVASNSGRILETLRTPEQPDRNAVLEANIETMREQVARCERWGKSHYELDVAIEETLAALKEPT